MSHEIRTPINAILGMAHILYISDISPKLKNFVTTIQTSSNTLLGLVNDILDFSKIEAGRMEVENINFNLFDLLDEARSIMSVVISDNNIAFDFEIEPETPMHLVGDNIKLKQILINLISNAAKFTDSGSIRVKVKSIHEDTQGRPIIEIGVEDSGIGISDEKLKKLFKPFAQADSSTTRLYGGSGLGLTISKSLAELLGGEIGVFSKEGEGSYFYVRIPFDLHGETEISKSVKSKIAITQNMNTIPKNILKDCKILVVDDNEINLEVMQELLSAYGAKPVIVSSGQDAIDTLKHDKDGFDIVLMDLQMPVMDGFETTIKIRDLGFENLTIIALTADATEQSKERTALGTFNNYMSKPINPTVLIGTIFEHLNLHSGFIQDNDLKSILVDDNHDFDFHSIDADKGLSAVGRNSNTYIKILNKFDATYADSHEIIQALIDKNDLESAKMLAHTIKGASATLGMNTLHKSLKSLEEAIGKNAIQKSHLDNFDTELQNCLADIRSIETKDRSTKIGNSAIIQIENIQSIYKKTCEFQTEAKEEAKAQLDNLSPDCSHRAFLEVTLQYLEQYEFIQARTSLEKLMYALEAERV